MSLSIGKHTYGTITLRGEMNHVSVGNYCSLGEGIIADGGFTHNTENISTYPFHAWNEPNRWPNNNVCRGAIVIENDVWIGEGTLLMSGIKIGNGAVIGARSIITKDVEPYTVVVGHHRVIKQRFSDNDIKVLQRLAWWDLPDEQVEMLVPYLHSNNVFELIKAIQKIK